MLLESGSAIVGYKCGKGQTYLEIHIFSLKLVSIPFQVDSILCKNLSALIS